MVHSFRILKCKNGHILPVGFDDNNCGCHSDGKPCILINCKKCIINNNEDFEMIKIPLSKEGVKEIQKLGVKIKTFAMECAEEFIRREVSKQEVQHNERRQNILQGKNN